MATPHRQNELGAARLALRTLGAAALYRPDEAAAGEPPVPLVGKQFALLAYLACAPDRAASRASLTDLFAPRAAEPDDPEREARAGDAVRNLLQQLRAKLGAGALGPPRADPVRLAVPIASDRDELLAAWERHDYAGVVRAYGGDFLPRFETVAGAHFAHWVEGERASLSRRFAHAARQAIARDLATAGDAEALHRAIQVARRLRDHDILAQDAWQLLLRCLMAAGEHGEAAVEGDRLRAAAAERGFELESATRAILGAVTADARRIGGTAEAAGDRTLDGAPARPTNVVGRAAEVAAILAAWDRARDGTLVHVHVMALAGFGKSALLADLRQRLRGRPAALGGTRAAEARARYASREVAYAFVADVARALAERPGGLGVPEWAAATLVGINPSLAKIYQAAAASTAREASAEHSPGTVARALQELVGAVALEGPLALFLDDLHWADAKSLETLAELLSACAELPVLLVSAARDACDALCSTTGARRLELHPLDAAAVTELLTRKAPLPSEPWARRLPPALVDATGGSPLFVAETLQLLAERSLLAANGGWTTSDAAALFAMLESGRATRRRIDDLPVAERRLLLLLAAGGAPLSAGRLRSAAAQPLAEFNASLTALERRGLVTRLGADWTVAHDEHARTVREASDDVAVRAAATAMGRAIATDAGDDLRELRRAGALLARGGDVGETARTFERYVRLARLRRDRRSDRALAREFLGEADGDNELVAACVRKLPWRVRARLVSRRHVATAAAVVVPMLIVAAVVARLITRPPPPPPDAVLVARRVSADGKTYELFPIPLDASRWAGTRVLDVPLSGRPRWRMRGDLVGNGGYSVRPDGRGWTGGISLPDSGVIDIHDLFLDGTARRLTDARLDDYMPSWAPDNSRFAFITSRWSRHGQYDIAIYDTLGGDARVRQVTGGEDTDWTPLWSPDGSRIAFVRQAWPSGRRRLCVIDSDGANLRCFPPEPNAELVIVGWSDARRVLLRRMVGSDYQFARFDLSSGTIDLADERNANAYVSPDGRFAVCTCPRQGYPPDTYIVYPVERPDEFAVLRVVGGDERPVDFLWAPTTPRPPFLARLNISTGLGPPVLGVSHQLRASGADTAGRPVAPGAVRWRSEDSTVATIDSTGRLTPHRAGRVTIAASAGGWRDARTTLTIAAPPERVLFDEDWTRGLEPTWRTHGVPRPLLVQSTEIGPAFLNNGDGSFFSGAYTARDFDTRDGLWLEAEVSAPINSPFSQTLVFSLINIADSAGWSAWDHVTGDGPPGRSWPGWSIRYPMGTNGEHLNITVPGEPRLVRVPSSIRAGRPFRVVMQIFPDGRCGVAIDGQPLWVSSASFLEPRVHVWLIGNSVDTRILVGRLRVMSGIAPGIIWEGARAPR